MLFLALVLRLFTRSLLFCCEGGRKRDPIITIEVSFQFDVHEVKDIILSRQTVPTFLFRGRRSCPLIIILIEDYLAMKKIVSFRLATCGVHI